MRINSLVAAAEWEKEVATLPPEESHHLARVLRVRPGQEITLFDGRGGVAGAVVESVGKSAVEARILRRWSVPPPAAQIVLVQAVPKPDRWDLVLQKAVELGVAAIQPVLTERTGFRADPKKERRWERIVINAAQQCEVRWLPELRPLERFEAVLPSLARCDLVLAGSLYEGARPLRDVPLAGRKRVALLIGPEGDFTPGEIDAAVAAGAVPVRFGDRILRTETAAIFGLSVLSCHLL